MKRLLIVSYFFPPLAGSGVFRPLRLSKYLGEFGWEITVLTVGKRARVLQDRQLLREIPACVRVERSASLEPRVPLLALRRLGLKRTVSRIAPWFNIPDDQRGWVPFATRRAASLLRRQPHHAVLSTAGPYSTHLIGLNLHERHRLPWVADFRDEWTTNPYLHYPSRWHRRLNERLEQQVLRGADRVTCVSQPWLDNLISLVPSEAQEKFRVHPNGYDGAHFVEAGPPPDRFRVVYTGAFYGHRSPEIFLGALRNAIEGGRISADHVEVLFVGHTADAAGLDRTPGCRLRVIEQQPFADAIGHLHDAAVLLLVIPPEGGAGNHTGKLFNYLAAGRPILALAPEPNVAADLIRRSRSGRVVPPDDPRRIEEALVGMYREWRAGSSLPDQDRELIATYEARPQARAWADLLEELVESGAPRRAGD